jgi:glycosyltransferase involved in cell wall biosynthesis
MRFVLFDPGFENMSSHHANVDRQLYLRAEKNADTLVILASKKFISNEQLDNQEKAFQHCVFPHFKTPCYTNNLQPLDVGLEQTLSQQFCEELHAAHRDSLIQSSDILIIHTCFSFHVLGLAKWLIDIKATFSGKLVVCGMFNPGKRHLKIGDDHVCFKWHLRNRLAFMLLNKVRGHIPLKLATSCQQYVNAYQNCTGMAFSLHPAVNYISPIKAQSKAQRIKRAILYLGSVKNDKGLDWLAKDLPDLLEQINDIDFFIHFNEASPGACDYLWLKEKLINLTKVHTNLKLHFNAMTQNEYEYQLSIGDAVVLMYKPQNYQDKTSGLLWDAARYPNLTFICTKGIWAEHEFTAIGGSPLTFRYGDTQDLITALNSWKNTKVRSLILNEYGKKINQSFADWCFSSDRDV